MPAEAPASAPLPGRALAQLWPVKMRRLTRTDLLALDQDELDELARRVYRRAWKRSGSRRHAKAVRRRLLRKLRPPGLKINEHTNTLLRWKRTDGPFLAALCPERTELWKPFVRRNNGEAEVRVKNFSFVDNPIGTCETLQRVVRAEAMAFSGHLHFDDHYVLDIAPYLMLAMASREMAPVYKGGRMSRPVQKVIEAVDLRQFLRMSPFPLDDLAGVHAFPLHRRGRPGGSSAPDKAGSWSAKDKVVDRLVTCVNEWLRALQRPLELSDGGKAFFGGLLGEILDNAERHGRREGDADWSVVGFMAEREIEGQIRYLCHLAILNEGWPIADSLRSGAQARDYVASYLRHHPHVPGCSPDTLATVVALQDTVSRFNPDEGNSRGGVGMMDMAQWVSVLGRTNFTSLQPRLCVISGRSCIMFRSPYDAGRIDMVRGQQRVQWFNAANDPRSAPDREHVFDLPMCIPGTLIATRFSLDAEMIAPSGGEDHADDRP